MKKILKFVLAFSMVFTLAACSSSDTGSDETKSYIIATDTTFPPFEMEDDEGNLIGIDIEILQAIAEEEGFEVEIQSLGFDASLSAIESGAADGMIAGMTITDERKEKYDFSDEYYESGVTMGVLADSGIESYEDLEGKIVVAKTSTSGLAFAQSIQDEYGFDLEVVEQSSYMYEKVQTGEADALFEDTPVLKYQISIGELNFALPCDNEDPCYYGFAVLKDENQELLEMFNEGLATIKENGTYDEILAEYEPAE